MRRVGVLTSVSLTSVVLAAGLGEKDGDQPGHAKDDQEKQQDA